MSRWLPSPVLAGSLFAIWMLLNESLAPGVVVLGAALAVAVSRLFTALHPARTSARRPRAALRLALAVLMEIVRSNKAVAQIILGSRRRDRRSGFVRIPLDTRNPYSLTALACIVTATPGTIWVEYESTGNTMLLHVLDLIDETEWVQIIKQRYEKPLMEIFG
jgi:multicomponent K+:H+ antiporter subunit E